MVAPSRVVIVGTGIGGLACAIDLARSGFEVTVVERSTTVGGKVRLCDVGGAAVDAGPTVLTMRWVFDELFETAGLDFEDFVALAPVDVLARHAWPDGSRLDLFADREKSAVAIAATFGDDEARRFRAFSSYAQRIYETVEWPFLRSQRPGFGALVKHASRIGIASLARIDAHRTMWRALEAHFRDPRLVQLFGRYATYCGSSPLEAPATLNLIAHVESLGVLRVEGGMSRLAAGLERAARRLGVAFRFAATVDEILVRGDRAAGVVLDGGEVIESDAVVCNADVAALGAGLFGANVSRSASVGDRESRSFSAVTWALEADVQTSPLLHHNVFFSSDYRAELRELTQERRTPLEPTVYVCAQDRADDDRRTGPERLLVIVNAPATGDEPDAWTNEERARCEENAFATMSRCGLNLKASGGVQTTPVEFHRLFPATGGALYGARSTGPFSSLARPGSRTKIPRLYLAGGSVHPGPGLPMAALSGRRAAESVKEDLVSIARSPQAATSGTISTA